ncbi:MAG: serine/threonine-protein kinase [Actinomycetota bacterium]
MRNRREELTGPRISGVRIERHVARGRSGDVYEAIGPDGAHLAVKVHDRADDGRREARRLRAVDHPSLARLVDEGELGDGRVWLALAWVEGRTLADLVADGPLDLPRARRLVRALGDAIDALHLAGVVHGDLSPRNVIVGDGLVTLIDLGAARLVSSSVALDETAGLDVDTTPRYAAPEVARGEPATSASDRYALAVLAYEAVTGASPYPEVATPIAMLGHHAATEPIPPTEHRPDLPAGVEAALLHGLEKDPDRRPPTGVAFARALRRDEAVGARDTGGRRRWFVAGAAVVLAAVLAGAALGAPSADEPGAVATDSGAVDATVAVPTTASSTPAQVVSAAPSTSTPVASAAPATTAGGSAAAPIETSNPVWPAGTSATLACNRLEVPAFEQPDLPDGFYGLDVDNTVGLVPDAGVDGTAALRVGGVGAYGLYAEIVPLGPEREHVFSAWVRQQGSLEGMGFHVDYLDADFRQVTFGRDEAIAAGPFGTEDGVRVTVRTVAPGAAAYAIPSIFKDASPGSLLVDEVVFGDAAACVELGG